MCIAVCSVVHVCVPHVHVWCVCVFDAVCMYACVGVYVHVWCEWDGMVFVCMHVHVWFVCGVVSGIMCVVYVVCTLSVWCLCTSGHVYACGVACVRCNVVCVCAQCTYGASVCM